MPNGQPGHEGEFSPARNTSAAAGRDEDREKPDADSGGDPREPIPAAFTRSRPTAWRMVAGSRRVLVVSSAVTLVAAGAFTVGIVASEGHGETTITTSSMQIPHFVGLPSYGTSSASPVAGPSGRAIAHAAVSVAPSPSPQLRSPTPAVTPAGPVPFGRWTLDQSAGDVAIDSAGSRDGDASNVTWSGGAAVLDGTNSQIDMSPGIVSSGPGRSFTVAVWVEMAALPPARQNCETAVSEDASVNSAFDLQYIQSSHRWAFARVGADVQNPSPDYAAVSTGTASLDLWTHLVGVFDASDDTMSLYVDGQRQDTVTDPAPFAGTGDFVVGRGQYDNAPTDWFSGRVRDIEVFDRALNADEVAGLS